MSTPIHALTVLELLEALNAGTLASVELVQALIKRRDEVNPKVRAVVHKFDESALARAAEIDRRRARGETVGKLCGLPMTIKESLATEGTPVTLGVKARLNKKESSDAVVVALLRDECAIILGKTNLSQLLLFHEADNPIWGATNNPFDLSRTPGGSSGGEAAAIAAGIAPAGIGTDIGGSIRVPAAFCGVAGFKPTLDRWSNVGSFGALLGQEVVRSQLGPIARTSRDVAFLFGVLEPAAFAMRDPAVPPLPVIDPADVPVAGLRIGVVEDDKFLAPSASVRRAVRLAADALTQAGATVVPFTPPHAAEVMDVYFGALSGDGGTQVDRTLSGEPVIAQLRQLRQIAGMSSPMRKAAAVAMGLKGEARIKRLLEVVSEKSVAELWALSLRRTELRRSVMSAWQKDGLVAVIGPAHATHALKHGQSGDFSLGGSYSMYYNFVNFPAGVVPVSRVAASDPVRQNPRDRIERRAAQVEADAIGLPLGIQVSALPWREEVALAVMIAIEDRVRGQADFPRTPVDP